MAAVEEQHINCGETCDRGHPRRIKERPCGDRSVHS